MSDENTYIPEYNPKKYKKASNVVKIIAVISLIVMIIGISIILLKTFLDRNSFLVNVNGVPQKDWSWIIISIGMVISFFGLPSLCLYVLHIRLKQANNIFAEPDENKRLEMHLKFDKQAQTAAKISAPYSATKVAGIIKKK